MIRTRIIPALVACTLLTPLAFAFDPFFGLFGDDEEKEPERVEAPDPSIPSLPYEVTVNGPADAELAARVKGELSLEKRKAKGVPSLTVLQSRLDNDLIRTKQVLSAFGYYDGTATGSISNTTPPVVTLNVDQGQRYSIGTFRVVWQEGPPPVKIEIVAEGLPASGQNIVNAGDRIIAQLKSEGYYDAKMIERRAVLDRPTSKVNVTLILSSGPVVRVGGYEVKGNEDLPDTRIIKLAKFKIGELLTPPALKEAEDNLIASALFDSARAEAVGTSPARTIRYTVDERLPRTVSGAAKYSVQDGFAIQAGWEHRNIFGDAEKLTTELTLGTQTQSFDLGYREFDFIWDDYTLFASANYTREDVDGAEYQQFALIGTLETQLTEHLLLRFGGSVEYTVDQLDYEDAPRNKYSLVGLRTELVYDDSNDLLDPTEGIRATFRVSPYYGISGDASQFTIIETIGSAYLPLDDDRKFVLAGRARLGSVVGATRDELPLSKRFYAGGGGSIRGFSYKMASPIIRVEQPRDEDDEDDEDYEPKFDNIPIGGKSVVELNGEFRYRINESFGAVAFVDAGGAYNGQFPKGDDEYFIGAGLGVRYYSPIGPIRFDVAIPVTQPYEDEPGYQIYISIGQAF